MTALSYVRTLAKAKRKEIEVTSYQWKQSSTLLRRGASEREWVKYEREHTLKGDATFRLKPFILSSPSFNWSLDVLLSWSLNFITKLIVSDCLSSKIPQMFIESTGQRHFKSRKIYKRTAKVHRSYTLNYSKNSLITLSGLRWML